MMRIVNVYGPTIKCVTDSTNKVSGISKAAEAYYDNVKTAIKVPARYDLFIAGDFNARLGSCSASDYGSGVSNNIGRYGNGVRNENGQMLLDFMITYNLFACNTAFKKWAKDTTSWKATCAAKGRPKGSKDTVEFYRQIDYILCRTSFKKCCFDAKSFPGDKVDSDHKPVVARFKLDCKYIVHKQHRPARIRFDVNRLNDPEVKFKFADSFMSNIKSRAMTDNVVSESEGILDVLRDVAVKVVGKVAPKKPQQFSNDPEIMSLSSERKAIAQENSQIKGPSDRTSQRKRRNYLKRSIKKRLKFLKGASADALADQINNADSCSRMFEAARTLAQGRVKKKGLTVHDADGNDIGSDSLKAEAIKEYFQKQLNDDDEPPFPAFIDPPGPLLCPITSDEVGRAVMKLKSGRACGPDGIPNH